MAKPPVVAQPPPEAEPELAKPPEVVQPPVVEKPSVELQALQKTIGEKKHKFNHICDKDLPPNQNLLNHPEILNRIIEEINKTVVSHKQAAHFEKIK